MMITTAHPGSRFAACTRWSALLVTGLFLGLMALGMVPQPKSTVVTTTVINEQADQNPDLTLYATIIKQLQAGQSYYPATAASLREGGYPLRPFVVFRLPTLAVVSAILSIPIMHGLIWTILVTTIYVWWKLLDKAFYLPARRMTGVMLIVVGLTITGNHDLIVLHEVWAGLLITLALGVYRPNQWLPSVILALSAALVRETAIPFVLLMAAYAAWERRGAELSGWISALALFSIVIIFHRTHVLGVTTLSDVASPGWVRFGGWSFFVNVMSQTTFLRAFPQWIGSITVTLALLGWASWRSVTGLIGICLLSGFAVMLMILGRPDNFYWGLIVAPLLPLGLAFVPMAFSDLRRAIVTP